MAELTLTRGEKWSMIKPYGQFAHFLNPVYRLNKKVRNRILMIFHHVHDTFSPAECTVLKR